MNTQKGIFVRRLVDEVLSATGQRCPIELLLAKVPVGAVSGPVYVTAKPQDSPEELTGTSAPKRFTVLPAKHADPAERIPPLIRQMLDFVRPPATTPTVT